MVARLRFYTALIASFLSPPPLTLPLTFKLTGLMNSQCNVEGQQMRRIGAIRLDRNYDQTVFKKELKAAHQDLGDDLE